MNRASNGQNFDALADLASFCFLKLADIEARFILLCHRAEAAGIDCTDLYAADVASPSETGPRLPVPN